MIVPLKDPAEDVVIVVGEVAMVAPSYFIVMVEEAAKPVPDTVTVEPTIPLVELSVIEAMMLNAAVAECEDASVAVTV